MTGIIDTHTHLESFARKGALDETLAAAAEAGVERLVTVGTEPEDWRLYAELAGRLGQVDFTVGIHPCSVAEGWRPGRRRSSRISSRGRARARSRWAGSGWIGFTCRRSPRRPPRSTRFRRRRWTRSSRSPSGSAARS